MFSPRAAQILFLTALLFTTDGVLFAQPFNPNGFFASPEVVPRVDTRAISPLGPIQEGPSLRVKDIKGSGSGSDTRTDGLRRQTNTWHLSAQITELPILSNPLQQSDPDLLIYTIPNAHVHLVFEGVAKQDGNPAEDIPSLTLTYTRTRDIQTDLPGMFLHYSLSKRKVVFVVIPIPELSASPDEPHISSIQYRDVDTDPFPNVFTTTTFPSGWLFSGNYHVPISLPCDDFGGDTDGDGLCDDWETNGLTLDKDGMPVPQSPPCDPDSSTCVPLHLMGADPTVKDIFVEVDYMDCAVGGCDPGDTHSHNPWDVAIDMVVGAFFKAPVDCDAANPKICKGIRLHVDHGPTSVMHPLTANPVLGEAWGSLSRSNLKRDSSGALIPDGIQHATDFGTLPFDTGTVCDPAQAVQNMKAHHFPEERRFVFHYFVFVHDRCGPVKNSGATVPFSTDSYISLGTANNGGGSGFGGIGTVWEQAGTFMHELGHSLGLDHGGRNGTNYKPNYLSVMNYSFQLQGLTINKMHPDHPGGSSYPFALEGYFDYSRFDSSEIKDLDTSTLDETMGLKPGGPRPPSSPNPEIGGYGTSYYCGPCIIANPKPTNVIDPIDWNCDSVFEDEKVSAPDINAGPLSSNTCQTSSKEPLKSYNDWADLIYNRGSIGGEGSSTSVPSVFNEEPAKDDITFPRSLAVEMRSPASQSLPPGGVAIYEFLVRNIGTNVDAYTITVTSAQGWADGSSTGGDVTLGPGSAAVIPVKTTIPSSIPAGAVDELIVEAKSQANPRLLDKAVVKTTVSTTPAADLAITTTDGVTTTVPGTTTTYTIVVSNNGPSAVTGAVVTDTLPAAVAGASWTCVASAGSACGAASGTGSIATTVNLLVGGMATYTVVASVAPSATGPLVNTASVAAPAGVTDPTLGNNTATDTDTLTPTADPTISGTFSARFVGPAPPSPPSVTTGVGTNNVAWGIPCDGVTNCNTSPGGPTPPSSLVFTPLPFETEVGKPFVLGTLQFFNGTVMPGTQIDSIALLLEPSEITSTQSVGSASSVMTIVNTPNTGDPNASADRVTLPLACFPASRNLATLESRGATATLLGWFQSTGSNALELHVLGFGEKTSGGGFLENPAQAPVVTIVATDAEASEVGPDPGTFTFSRTGDTTCDLTVSYTVTGTATNGVDYAVIGSTVTIPAGSATAVRTIAPIADAVAEGTETVILTLNTSVHYTTGLSNSATVTIADAGPPLDEADLAITKTDGVTAAVPGTTTTYTIVVSNSGPSPVTGAVVTDTLPAAITSASWTCVASAGSACGAPSGTGNIATTANLLVGGTATYTVVASIVPSAIGSLVNTASVAAPVGVTDRTPGNNTATDTDTLTATAAAADLAITKTDGVTAAVPGTTTTYTIVVSNSGPSPVTGAVVTDTLPAAITSASWTCVASAGSACGAASGTGNIATTVNLLVGGTATYAVVANIASSATGSLVNTASVAAPAGVTDPTPTNNTATDTDTLTPIAHTADLAISKTRGVTAVPGATTTYTIVVSNSGPSAVTGAMVTDTLPAAITSASWTCVASAGSACGTASDTGNIATTVDLLVGGTATYTLVASIAPSATGSLVNKASVAAPAGVTDPAPDNNTATDASAVTPNPAAIPTLSEWGMLLLFALLVGIACATLRARTFRL